MAAAKQQNTEKLTGIYLTKPTTFRPGDLSLGSIVTLSELFNCSETQGVDKEYVSKMIQRKGTVCFQLLPRVPQQ